MIIHINLYAARYPDRKQKSYMAFKRLAERFCRLGTVKQTRVKRRPIVNEVHRELKKVYGDAALTETTCRDWFRRFKDGDFDVDDRPREGRPKTFEDSDVIYYELLEPKTKNILLFLTLQNLQTFLNLLKFLNNSLKSLEISQDHFKFLKTI